MKEDPNDHDTGMAEEWTDLVDRGGLWHVHETTFQLFYALKEEVQTSALRAQFVEKLDVYWCQL